MTLFAAKTKRQAEPAEPQTRPRRKLTRAERKQIEAAIARANRTGKKEQSAQDSIPYERMWPDGICKVADGRYTKTIQFQDINYQLSQNEDKTAIFEGWCDFLNYFDSSIRFQLSFLNLAASQETFANSITIPALLSQKITKNIFAEKLTHPVNIMCATEKILHVQKNCIISV